LYFEVISVGVCREDLSFDGEKPQYRAFAHFTHSHHSQREKPVPGASKQGSQPDPLLPAWAIIVGTGTSKLPLGKQSAGDLLDPLSQQ
jgi:hypothetical protein